MWSCCAWRRDNRSQFTPYVQTRNNSNVVWRWRTVQYRNGLPSIVGADTDGTIVVGRLDTILLIWFDYEGTARTQSPTTKNCTPELFTFGIIARVSPPAVQWKRPRPGPTSEWIKVKSVPGKYDWVGVDPRLYGAMKLSFGVHRASREPCHLRNQTKIAAQFHQHFTQPANSCDKVHFIVFLFTLTNILNTWCHSNMLDIFLRLAAKVVCPRGNSKFLPYCHLSKFQNALTLRRYI